MDVIITLMKPLLPVEIIKNIGPMNKRIGIGWAKCKYKYIPWDKITFHPGYIVEGTYYLEKRSIQKIRKC